MSNDDMFFLVRPANTPFVYDTDAQTPLSTSDFHHPLLGPILRMAPGLPVNPRLTADLLTTHGEWGGLQHASALLSRRFADRPQPYPEHFPKSLTLPMMDEASIMFAEPLSIAATRGFRESKRGTADIEMAALASWLRIERWREALLWTWIVGKIGGEDGIWGEEAREAITGLFGDGLKQGVTTKIRRGPRSTLRDAEAYMEEMGLEAPLKTRIKFCKSPLGRDSGYDS
jgi:3-O-alpha-D-mannopyranosyl-alpha-D-mannopyranose xylosylphosphotransferase